jgi:hypothetical protein
MEPNHSKLLSGNRSVSAAKVLPKWQYFEPKNSPTALVSMTSGCTANLPGTRRRLPWIGFVDRVACVRACALLGISGIFSTCMADAIDKLVSACVRGKNAGDFAFARPVGRSVRDFRRTWTSACEHVGISGLLVHDLRRTAARQGAGMASPKR